MYRCIVTVMMFAFQRPYYMEPRINVMTGKEFLQSLEEQDIAN